MKQKKRTYALERNYERVGKFLKEQRAKSGFTQLQVANALGYSSPQAISNFEAGIEVPTLRKIAAFEKLYKFNVIEMLNLILEIERGFVELAPKNVRRGMR